MIKRAIWIISLIPLLLMADYLEVVRPAKVKHQAQPDGTLIERAFPGTWLELVNDITLQNGYYQVYAPRSQESGWIYRTLVKRHPGALPSKPNKQTDSNEIESCQKHLPYGLPVISDQIICRLGYALGYNYQRKAPDWVAYMITRPTMARLKRLANFIADPAIPHLYHSNADDYNKSTYDRGHMVPSAIIHISQAANDQTFYYSNITPQLPAFNRSNQLGIWGTLENKIRKKWLMAREQLYIIAGTYYDKPGKTVGPNQVAVPSHFFKIIYDPIRKQAIAFWLPHKAMIGDRLHKFITTIHFIEQKTQMKFLTAIEDRIGSSFKRQALTIEQWEQVA